MAFSLVKLVTLLSLAAGSIAKPVASHRAARELSRRDQSFNNFDGRQSLSNFDDFNGNDNFDGSRNQQIIIKEKKVVCEQIDVRVIQQKLTILREYIKRTLIEQVCEVETQTLVLEQFSSSVDNFSRDIRRQSNRQVSFDSSVSELFIELQDSEGNLSRNDLGFNGNDVGKNSVSYSGDNWNSGSSSQSVGNIWNASQNSRNQSQNQNASSVQEVDQPQSSSNAESETSSAESSSSTTASSSAASASVTNVNSD